MLTSKNFLQDSKTLPASQPTTDEPSGALPTFEELSKQRKLLREFCIAHVPSLEFFHTKYHSDCPVFKVIENEEEPVKSRHITSSATCYASIAACPEELHPENSLKFALLGEQFADAVVGLDLDEWKSDSAADIYCSCRGLPYVISKLRQWNPRIDDHLGRIFYQLTHDESARFAIGEAAENKKEKNKTKERKNWYKPNSYHTYWSLRTIRVLKNKFHDEYEKCANKPTREQCSGMKLWSRQELGYQVALHSASSSALDSDQLGWSLAILLSEPQNYISNLAEQDFVRQALQCLFSTQESIGTWRHYAPIFLYPNVGNAYCYVFETFAAILSEALRPEAVFVRLSLKRYFPQLIKLWKYAESTRAERGKARLWSSGHRVKPGLESWATASVFEFAQALRRLIGIWTRESALSTLNHKHIFTNKEEAKTRLLERSDIWTREDLADRFWSMFINPIEAVKSSAEIDPDKPLINKEFPRAAILFGPPGTSKTALVGAIAGAIGWDYIELHPSHFVADGLPNVQQTADIIFSKLMELDRAVILFDEIDELVRERDIEPDQFGRFLTTSMLPRLAELWKARKVMYFVATNHIEYFDRAVTRSERFDAIIFISPPSFKAKQKTILEVLKKEHHIEASFESTITEASIKKVMESVPCKSIDDAKEKGEKDRLKSQSLPDDFTLAKFAMLRFDELNELALHLKEILAGAKAVTEDILKSALKKIKDAKSRNLGEYCRFLSDQDYYERFDASRNASWIVVDIDGSLPSQEMKNRNAPVGPITNLKVPGFSIEAANIKGEAGRIRLKAIPSPLQPKKKASGKTKHS